MARFQTPQELMKVGELELPISNEASPRTRRWVRTVSALKAVVSKRRRGIRDPVIRTLEHCQEGYPRLAALLSSDENFMLYRRFAYLQARILLNKQDELRALEDDLDHLDSFDGAHNPSVLRSRDKDSSQNADRKDLLLAIENKFKEYTSLLTTAQTLASFNKPPHRDWASIRNYFERDAPLCNTESYIYYKEDLLTLKPGRERAWLDQIVEKLLRSGGHGCAWIRWIFASDELRVKADHKTTGILLFSRERISIVVSLIIIGTIVALLTVPVYILSNLNNPSTQIGVLLGFTMLFSLVLLMFTTAKRHELLAAAAAYCAVLVVFIGNVGAAGSVGQVFPLVNGTRSEVVTF